MDWYSVGVWTTKIISYSEMVEASPKQLSASIRMNKARRAATVNPWMQLLCEIRIAQVWLYLLKGVYIHPARRGNTQSMSGYLKALEDACETE